VNQTTGGKTRKEASAIARGGCFCGAVRFEMAVPAVWAWHDHSRAGRRAHGGAYATYVGSWKSRFRLTQGEEAITRFDDPASGAVRSFCAHCGTPLFYERAHSKKMINIPRALFEAGVGREPRYHVGVEETAPWEYAAAPLRPLKGFPGVVWEGPGRKKRDLGGMF
jgi:hypothetical protein